MSRRNYFCIAPLLVTWSRPAFAQFSKCTQLIYANLTCRVEAFNLFNRVQFGPPNTQASTAANNTFGKVTTQVNQPRLMQLAFHITF